jgi:sensor histidine kinase YesM
MDNLYRERFYHHFDARTVLVNLLYTIVIDTFIAVFLTLTGIFTTAVTLKTFIIMLIISQCYGISIYVIIMLLFLIFKPPKGISAVFIILLCTACGILIGRLMAAFILQQALPTFMWAWKKTFLKEIGLWLALLIVIYYFFYSKRHLKISKEIIQQERINRLSSEKEALEANLRLLQAQIEPHFLFNTLSNILSLLDTDLKKGRSMLMDLIRYLRTSLAKTRAEATTLGQEMEMIKAYLNIFKVRMEGRLRYRIDVPANLKGLPFPPMLIQPLVENAIKHGIEPKIEGGEVTIRTRKDGDMIRVELADTGTGLLEDGDMGFGLSNVRERLQSLYGDRGQLILEENQPCGLKAIIEIPYGKDHSDHRR